MEADANPSDLLWKVQTKQQKQDIMNYECKARNIQTIGDSMDTQQVTKA